MTFKRYPSRPITRLAYEIQEDDVLSSRTPGEWQITVGTERVTFKAHAIPETGDFVVYQNAEDIYHCPREVFLGHSVVPGDDDE